MRISDWSSDVCSSDLRTTGAAPAEHRHMIPRRVWSAGTHVRPKQGPPALSAGEPPWLRPSGAWCIAATPPRRRSLTAGRPLRYLHLAPPDPPFTSHLGVTRPRPPPSHPSRAHPLPTHAKRWVGQNGTLPCY